MVWLGKGDNFYWKVHINTRQKGVTAILGLGK